MLKVSSLSVKTLIYFCLFAVVILFVVWVSQIEFLDYSFEKNQIKTIKEVANDIGELERNGNFSNSLEEIAYKNDMCIEYISEFGTVDYNYRRNGCVLGKNNSIVNSYKEELINNDLDFIKIVIPNTKYKSILYKVRISNSEFVFMNTTLEDISQATQLLKEQLIYIIITIGLLAIIMSAAIARMINKPIINITKNAKELSKGNYNVTFEKSNIAELNELSNVLTIAASEMNKTDELKKDLIANVSHDLKTPLTMIKAYAEKVRDLTYNNPEKREKDLNVIIGETDRLNILVNDLLDLNKLQKNAEELNIELYDLVGEVKEIIKRYDILVENEGYKFELNMPKVALIKADKSKLNQVIYNLINNAIEHTGDDLTVKVTIKLSRGYYTVSITDSGKGLTDEEKLLVWNKYYKKEKKHKRNVVGTGIGLSIVKEILEKHKFEYGIDSELGKFTTFYFKVKNSK